MTSTTTHQSQTSLTSADSARPLLNHLLRIYCRVVVVLMIYVLSTGPMYWAIYEAFNMGGSSFLAKLYFPIALACENEVICAWFDWYVGLWVY